MFTAKFVIVSKSQEMIEICGYIFGVESGKINGSAEMYVFEQFVEELTGSVLTAGPLLAYGAI